MIKFTRILFLALIVSIGIHLTGCCPAPIKPEPIVVTKTVEITKLPPSELLQIPAPIPAMAASATQADAADWLIRFYNRSAEIENKLLGISTFFSGKDTK